MLTLLVFSISVLDPDSDPDPNGYGTFAWIRIRNYSSWSGSTLKWNSRMRIRKYGNSNLNPDHDREEIVSDSTNCFKLYSCFSRNVVRTRGQLKRDEMCRAMPPATRAETRRLRNHWKFCWLSVLLRPFIFHF